SPSDHDSPGRDFRAAPGCALHANRRPITAPASYRRGRRDDRDLAADELSPLSLQLLRTPRTSREPARHQSLTVPEFLFGFTDLVFRLARMVSIAKNSRHLVVARDGGLRST